MTDQPHPPAAGLDMAQLRRGEPLLWTNPVDRAAAAPGPGQAGIDAAVARWQRFAPLLALLFPELAPQAGVIESDLLSVPASVPTRPPPGHPMHPTTGPVCSTLAAAALAAPLAGVRAETDFPTRGLQLVVPFPAGGATDVVGRLLAKSLGDRLANITSD